jgi:hypothetical protein
MQYVFTYGSLLDKASLLRTLPEVDLRTCVPGTCLWGADLDLDEVVSQLPPLQFLYGFRAEGKADPSERPSPARPSRPSSARKSSSDRKTLIAA